MELHIAIVPEKLGELFGIPVTNTLLTSWLVIAALAVFAFFVSRSLNEKKPGAVQNFIEMLFAYVFDFMEEVLGNRKKVLAFFPLIATLFLFVWASNWAEFIPGVGSIGIGGECEHFFAVSQDLLHEVEHVCK